MLPGSGYSVMSSQPAMTVEDGRELGEGGEGDEPPYYGPAVEEQDSPAVVRRRATLVGIVPVYCDGSGCNARKDTQAEAVVAGPQCDGDDGEDQHKEGDDELGDADGEGPVRDGDESVCRHGGLMGLGLVIKGGRCSTEWGLKKEGAFISGWFEMRLCR